MITKNTPWKGWDLEKAAAAFVEAFVEKPAPATRPDGPNIGPDQAETVAALKWAMAKNGVNHCEWQKASR